MTTRGVGAVASFEADTTNNEFKMLASAGHKLHLGVADVSGDIVIVSGTTITLSKPTILGTIGTAAADTHSVYGRILFGNSVTSYTNITSPSIYATVTGGTGLFNEAGHLILEPRLNGATRDVIVMGTGAVPVARFNGGGAWIVGPAGSTTTAKPQHTLFAASIGWSPLKASVAGGGPAAGDLAFILWRNRADANKWEYGISETRGAGSETNPGVYWYSYATSAEVGTINPVGAWKFGSSSSSLNVPHQFTGSGSSNSSAVLDILSANASDKGSAALRIVKFDNDGTAGAQKYIYFYFNQAGSGGAGGAIVSAGGNAATFGAISDRREKENIRIITPQLNKILALKPVSFNMKDSGLYSEGFIAQDIQQVYPDSVTTHKHEGTERLMLVGWDKTDARIVKALQESVSEYRTEIASLRTQNRCLAEADTKEERLACF